MLKESGNGKERGREGGRERGGEREREGGGGERERESIQNTHQHTKWIEHIKEGIPVNGENVTNNGCCAV